MSISVPLEDNFEASLVQTLAADTGALTIYLSKVPVCTIPAGKEVVLTLNPKKGFTGSVQQENVLIESIDTVNKTVTVKTGGRAQSRYNGDTPTVQTHSVGTKVIMSDPSIVWGVLDDYLPTTGGTMTGDILFTDANNYIKKVGTDLHFKSDAQADVSLATLAAAAGVDDKFKISATDTTSGYANSKLAVGTGLTKTVTSPSGNEGLTIGIDTANNATMTTAIANNLSGIANLATTGTANTTLSSGDALAYDGQQRLIKADGNTLNPFGLFAGIATSAGTTGNSMTYSPTGIVTVPAFTLAQRANCRTWTGESNTTQNTTTDTINATTAWRAQTFIPQVGQDNISSVTINITNNSIVGTMTAAIYATSAGLPTGSALCSGALAVAAATSNLPEITLNSGVPFALTPGTTYALVIYLSAYTSGSFAWNYNNSSVYANGNSCTSSNSGGSWTAEATYDRYFVINYKGIAGEPVFLSDTDGALQLSVGTYENRIGNAISTTQVLIKESNKVIKASLSGTFTSTTSTVTTTLTCGFRPRFILADLTAASGCAYVTWNSMGSSGIQIPKINALSLKTTQYNDQNFIPAIGSQANGGTNYTSAEKGGFGAEVCTCAININSVSADSIVILRSITWTSTPSSNQSVLSFSGNLYLFS